MIRKIRTKASVVPSQPAVVLATMSRSTTSRTPWIVQSMSSPRKREPMLAVSRSRGTASGITTAAERVSMSFTVEPGPPYGRRHVSRHQPGVVGPPGHAGGTGEPPGQAPLARRARGDGDALRAHRYPALVRPHDL